MHPLALIYGSTAARKHTETPLLQTPGKRRQDRKQGGGGLREGKKERKRQEPEGGALFIILARCLTENSPQDGGEQQDSGHFLQRPCGA